MLVVTRKTGQRLFIGSDVVVTVSRVLPDGRVRLGIQAPKEIVVAREELLSQGGGSCSASERSNSASSGASR